MTEQNFDFLQFECCGINNNTDWNKPLNNTGLPMSCCKFVFGQVGNSSCNSQSPNVFPKGCLPAFGDFIKAHAVQLGGVGIGIAFVQVCFDFIKIINNIYYLFLKI